MLNLLCLVVVHMFVVCSPMRIPLRLTTSKGNKTSHADLIRLNSLTANLAGDTFQNETKVDLTMDSVMLHSVLRWRKFNNDSRYSVYYRSSEKWTLVKSCANITSNYCDVTDYLDALITYDFKLRNMDQNRSYILRNFLPEYDTKLLPPKLKSSRHDHVISIQPIVELHSDTRKPILQDLTTLDYQVKYWPSSANDDLPQRNMDKIKTVSNRNTEIVIDSLDPKKRYCFVLRYYEESYANANCTSGSSEWGNVHCHNATVFVTPVKEHPSKVTIITLASVVVFVIILVLLYKGWSIYKLIQKDRKIPDYLLKAFAEFDKKDAATNWLEMKDPEEKPEPIIVTRFPARQVYENDPTLVGSRHRNEQRRFVNRELPANDLSPAWCHAEDEIVEVEKTKEARCPRKVKKKKKRKRGWSGGYHSASSDDAMFDVSMLPDESGDYAQTTTKFLHASPSSSASEGKASSSNVTVAHVTPTLQKECDNDSHPTYAGYTCMNGKEKPRNSVKRLSANSKVDMELLPLNGTSPYENYTYCSNLYGNIPDVFLPR